MAAGPATWYTNGLLALGNKQVDLSADTLVMTLVTSGYTPSVDTDSTWSAVSGSEVATGNGYTQGGLVLAGVTWANLAGASFSGALAGTALTVSNVSGTVYPNTLLAGSGVSGLTFITSGAGTSWAVNVPQSIASEPMTTSAIDALDFTAPQWASFSATFKYGVLVHRAGASLASGDILIGYFDASVGSGSITGGSGTLTITPGTPGFLTNVRGNSAG